MKSDLTCPVEVVSVAIQRENEDTKDNGHGSTNAGEKTEPGRKPADDPAASDDPPSSEDENPQDRGWSGYY